MRSHILLPRYFKLIGFAFYLLGYIIYIIFKPNLTNLLNGLGLLIQVMILTGLLMMCFSKQKVEDEFIQYYRQTSLQWAVIVFVFLRLLYKTLAFVTQNLSWEPQWQVNALILIYLILFYYQLYIKDLVVKLVTKVIYNEK